MPEASGGPDALRARLAALEQRVAELAGAEEASRALSEIGRDLAATLDPDETTRHIVDVVVRFFRTPAANLYRLDEGGLTLTCTATGGPRGDDRWLGRRFSVEQGSAGRAVRSAQVVYWPDIFAEVPADTMDEVARTWLQTHQLRSALAVPLIARGETLGALVLADVKGRAYSERDVELAAVFGAQAALALQNARLFTATERRRREAESLLELGRLVSRSLDPAEVTAQIVTTVRALLSVPFAILYQLEPESGALTRVAVDGAQAPLPVARLARGTGVVGMAVEQRRPVYTADLVSDAAIRWPEHFAPGLITTPYRAILAVPLVARDKVVGALALGRPVGETFTDDEVRLTQLFADQAGLAFANAALLERAAERARRMTALSALVQHIASSADSEAVFQAVGDAAVGLLKAKTALVWIDDRAAGTLRLAATSSDAQRSVTRSLWHATELPDAETLSRAASKMS
jgi:GAF domain-containing protein